METTLSTKSTLDVAKVIYRQADSLRVLLEPLNTETRQRIADILRAALMATTDEEFEELTVSVNEIVGAGSVGDLKSKSLDQWIDADPKLKVEVRRLQKEKKAFAERVRKRMSDRNLTQQQLAEVIGISQPTLHDLINGKHKPQPKTLKKLADALRCKVEDLWPT